MKELLKRIGIILLITLLFGAWICLALTPLWMYIANGHSIHGGINDTPLSFGLAFIGTFFAIGGSPITIFGD